jgi:hypothetical protein
MPAAIQIGVDVTGLDPGVYNSTVTISASAIAPAIRTVAVQLTVAAGGPPHLDVDSRQLTYSLTEGGVPVTSHLSVINGGAGTLDFTAGATTASGGTGWPCPLRAARRKRGRRRRSISRSILERLPRARTPEP